MNWHETTGRLWYQVSRWLCFGVNILTAFYVWQWWNTASVFETRRQWMAANDSCLCVWRARMCVAFVCSWNWVTIEYRRDFSFCTAVPSWHTWIWVATRSKTSTHWSHWWGNLQGGIWTVACCASSEKALDVISRVWNCVVILITSLPARACALSCSDPAVWNNLPEYLFTISLCLAIC